MPFSALERRFFQATSGLEVVKQGASTNVRDAVERIQVNRAGKLYDILMVLEGRMAEIDVQISGRGELSECHKHWIDVINSISPLPAIKRYFEDRIVTPLQSPTRTKREASKDPEILEEINRLPDHLAFLAPAVLDLASQAILFCEDADLSILEQVVHDQLNQVPRNKRKKFLAILCESYDKWCTTLDKNKPNMKAFAVAHGALCGFSMFGFE